MLHHNELINIEEDTILGPRSVIRRFTLQNRANRLAVSIITSGGTVSSIKLDIGKQETIVSPMTKDANGGSVPAFLPASHEWQSHVLGLDTLMLTATSSQSLLYQLTSTNDLLITGKIKSHMNAMAPFYFNLNNATNGCPIDGHFLHIRSSDVIPDLPISVSTDTPFELTGPSPNPIIFPQFQQQNGGEPLNIIYDAIYGCLAPPTSGIGAVLVATLAFERRSIEMHLQSNSSQPNQPVKLRVRIKRDGISLMPTSMNEFKCIYKLRW